MLNSLFMLGSSYNKNKKVSIIFMIAWIAYMLVKSDLYFGSTFAIINALVFLTVSVVINFIKNKKANIALSVMSILIWSIIVDTICYFIYPPIDGQTLIGYIFQGILFNYKYVFSNIIAISMIYGIDLFIEKMPSIWKAHKKTTI